MSRLLIVRPHTDQVEESLSAWADVVLKAIASAPQDFSHIVVDDLFGPGLTHAQVANLLVQVDAVIFYGHGQPDCLGSPVLIDSAGAASVGGGAVVAFACSAGEQLGPDAVAAGLGSFVGFTDDFVLVDDTLYAPWSVWMEAAITGALISRGNVQDVYDALVARFEWIFQLFKEGKFATTRNAPLIWMTADWNLRHLTLVGNATCAFL